MEAMIVREERRDITTRTWYYKIVKIKETKKDTYLTVITTLCAEMVNDFPEHAQFSSWRRARNNGTIRIKKEKEYDANLNELYGWYVRDERLMANMRLVKWEDIPELHQAHLLNPSLSTAR
jgi:hypothetical protein